VVLLLLAAAAGHAAVQGVSGAALQACSDAWQLLAAPHSGLLHISHLCEQSSSSSSRRRREQPADTV
jgi:hypothetical protein